MAPFPSLQLEQEALLALIRQYDVNRPAEEKVAAIGEICRTATIISQLRNDVLYPQCARLAPPPLLASALVASDLIRIIVHELSESDARVFVFDGFVSALGDLCVRMFENEKGPSGLWEACVRHDLDVAAADQAADEWRKTLRSRHRLESWETLAPEVFETLQSSVPLGAYPGCGPDEQPFASRVGS